MAYSQGGGGDSKMPWIVGGAALLYLWYEGYLASWFPTIFGTTTVASTTPTTSVNTASTTPTVNQTAGVVTLPQVASASSIATNTVPSQIAVNMAPFRTAGTKSAS